jgi:phage major head subunit gpT-like protein
MPLTKGDLGNLGLAGVKAAFYDALDNVPVQEGIFAADWREVATLVPSTLDTEKYGWLGQLPQMREFKDERKVKGIAESDYQLTNKLWESTIGVDRRAWDNDQSGTLRPRIMGLAAEYNRKIEEEVFTCLAKGNATTSYGACYDGLAFFTASTHVLGANTIDNLDTDALAYDKLQGVIAKMAVYKGEADSYLGVKPSHLITNPKMMWTARELLMVRDTVTAAGWTLQGALKLLVSPYLALDNTSNTSCWIVADLSRSIKPIIVQQKGNVEFDFLGRGSDTAFMTDQYRIGIRAEFVVGYGPPWLAHYNVVA